MVNKTWKSGQIGEGFVYYLDQKLFGSNDSVIVSEVRKLSGKCPS